MVNARARVRVRDISGFSPWSGNSETPTSHTEQSKERKEKGKKKKTHIFYRISLIVEAILRGGY